MSLANRDELIEMPFRDVDSGVLKEPFVRWTLVYPTERHFSGVGSGPL